MNAMPPNQENGGPALLAKIAKQYASKGQKAFTFGPHESKFLHVERKR
jgi:hypothetical protein